MLKKKKERKIGFKPWSELVSGWVSDAPAWFGRVSTLAWHVPGGESWWLKRAGVELDLSLHGPASPPAVPR